MAKKLVILVILIAVMTMTCKAQNASIVVNSLLLERFDAGSNYTSAETKCEGKSARRLVEIKTQEIQDAVDDLIKGPTYHAWWIGGTQTDQGFQWNDGTNLTYTNWDKEEPNGDHEKCIEVNVFNGKWNDLRCDKSYPGYICQTDLRIPVIFNTSAACREVNIKWLAAATSVIHRFSITAANSKEGNSMYRNVTSGPDAGLEETTISGLQAATKYIIVIHVCPDLCIDKLNASSQVTTAVNVISGPVQEAFLTLLSDGNCFVNWRKPNEIEQSEIQGYQIITGGQQVYSNACTETPKNISTEIYNVTNQVTQFLLQTSPNRDYSVKIQTRTCAGYGPAVTATGSCITQRSAPTNVLVPELLKTNKDETMEMRIQIPEESNGPISCLFLIMKLGEISTDFSFTINDLNQAQAAAKASSLADNAQYITTAITRVTVPFSFNLTVGDNTKSFCNPGKVYGSMNTKNEDVAVYEGRNWPLRDGKTYSYFAVTTMSVGNQIVLKTSPVNKFVTKSTSEPTLLCIYLSTLAGIIVPAIIISLIVGGLVGSYIMNRRLQVTSLPNSQNINCNPAFQEPTNNLPQIDDGIYEPMAGQSSTG